MDDLTRFHLLGTRSEATPPIDGLGLRPALFARVGDLTRLRYDFPLVLVDRDDGEGVESLSGLVDALLAEVAPGIAGERTRRAVLRLERAVRARVATGETGKLGALWDQAANDLGRRGGEQLVPDLARARAALRVDGELVDCDARLPARFVTHLWQNVQSRRARATRRLVDVLALGLADLVRADFLRSEAGRRADTLAAAIGSPHHELFDFAEMARLLAAPSGPSALPDARRKRIQETLWVIGAAHLFAEPGARWDFAFDRVDAALAAYRERRPAVAELVRAMAIAQLELRGAYEEGKHDAYFAAFGPDACGPDDLALFPDYLVRLDPRASDAEGRARVVEALASGAPLKVLLETDDLFGLGAQLATTAMGLGDAFVLQIASSHLHAGRAHVARALDYRGPALISVFSTPARPDGVAPYLASAAAAESRAFPSFSYDPSAGRSWAQRFALHDNPQPDRPWPVHRLTYGDEALQRRSDDVPFTLADLAVCDPGRAAHFARVPRDRWDGSLAPLGAWLDGGANGTVPFVYAVDGAGAVHKLLVDERLALATRRSAEAWERLRQLDELKRERLAPVPAAVAVPEAMAATAPAPGAEAPPAEPTEPASDQPYIETARCTTCNECTGINGRMFAYNGNKQAYVKDPSAGTYRELVEAAESCQVAIIHPGKPRDPSEPGLEELLARAEAFR